MNHPNFDETSFRAGRVSPVNARYTLVMIGDGGATEQTSHSTKAGVRAQIRTWDARGMSASVSDEGKEIYSGSALSF